MENKKDFIKIRTFLILKDGDKISINDNATFNASEEFIDRINAYDEGFREKVMTFINEAIGLHNWAVIFAQFTLDDSIFDVKVFAENENDFLKIKSIILERITDRQLNFYYSGTINNYLKNP